MSKEEQEKIEDLNYIDELFSELARRGVKQVSAGLLEVRPMRIMNYKGEEVIETMSKELSPLEVSKQLKDFVFELELGKVDKLFVRGSFDIIETALKRLEGYENHTVCTMVNQINALRDENEELRKRLNEMYELREQYHLDQNKLRAFEIIKEKGLDIREFRYASSLYEYNICKNIGCKELTQEEYDLLKEVLLWVKMKY